MPFFVLTCLSITSITFERIELQGPDWTQKTRFFKLYLNVMSVHFDIIMICPFPEEKFKSVFFVIKHLSLTISISITHIDRTNWKFLTHISCSCWCKWLTYTPTDKADEKSTFVHKSMAAYGAWSIFTFIVIHLLASFPSSSEYSSKTKLPALEQCIGQCPQAAEHFIPCLMQLHLAL